VPDSRCLLAGDVGGTKTILAQYRIDEGRLTQHRHRIYPNSNFANLEAVLLSFLEDVPSPVDFGVFAVAGPIRHDRAILTNLPWIVDARALETRFAIERVILMNDVEALSTAIPELRPQDVLTLSPGKKAPHGSIAVAAVGTGLGQSYLTWNGTTHVAHPSEGGHTDFAPTTAEQMRLLTFLSRTHDHVSVEQVCSGLGIANLYRFLQYELPLTEERELSERIASEPDPTPLIVEHAVSGRSQLCARALHLFVEILGAELGNLALTVMATGGAYLGGGIPPRILPFIGDGALERSFRRKGRFERLLSKMPLSLILDSDAVVRGAARRAVAMCAEMDERPSNSGS
jgi:glucokinase